MSDSQKFYLGRLYDPAKGEVSDQPLFYDPANLTTHALVTGMTGSGKTGLCIDILEEAALPEIPAIIIDPKGDLTNLLLHFPRLQPQDFQPWLDEDSAHRDGKDLVVLATEIAARWQKGLADWGLGSEQLLKLQNSTQYTIYTPGSTSGKAINLLSSFSAPEIPWEDNREVLREKIATIVSALLGLIGLKDIDPLRSREHILLSNLLENAWSHNQPFDLFQMIVQTQNPPFDRLGVFPLDSFFPAKERLDLALLLNNFLAAPSFQSWLEGQPLEIAKLLYTPDGRSRHSIFYLAHLSEAERMFFVTLLFASVEAWMRAQRGTSGLRMLVYFDEILGYLPAVSNPPSRPILLRMLKQARAFGVGLLLATQNPVDVDYKALSNAGTWFIGRLQTDQDKQRLMDGLRSAGGSVDVTAIDRLISGLKQRVFLLHNINQPAPLLFQTRWTLNYLAGPLTRAQIPGLNSLAGDVILPPVGQFSDAQAGVSLQPVKQEPLVPVVTGEVPIIKPAAERVPSSYSRTRPSIPTGLVDFFLPAELTIAESLRVQGLDLPVSSAPESLVYHPALIAQAQVRYLSQRYQVEYSKTTTVLVAELSGSLVKWDDFLWKVCEVKSLDHQPLPGALFAPIPDWLPNTRGMDMLKKDFVDWVFRNSTIYLRNNVALKVTVGPQVSEADFHKLCTDAARNGVAVETSKVTNAYTTKLNALRQKISRQQAVVDKQADEMENRKMEDMSAAGELVLSMFTKRRRSVSTTLSKHRLAQEAKTDLQGEHQELEQLKTQLAVLEQEAKRDLGDIQERWEDTVREISQIPLAPTRQNIFVELFGIGWMPYFRFETAQGGSDSPAFHPYR